MRYYKSYMNRQQVSADLHEKLLTLPTAEQADKPQKRAIHWQQAVAMAACAALLVGVGIGARGWLPATPTVETVRPESTDSPDTALVDDGVMAGTNFHSFTVPSDGGGKMTFPAISYIAYPDAADDGEVARSIAVPEGAFSKDLTEEEVCLILWGSREAMENAHMKAKTGNVPWILFWDGYTVAGRATYDGHGDLWQAMIWGYNEEGAHFEITLAPGHLPPACVVNSGGEVTEIDGVEVTAWKNIYDRDGDGVTDYVYESAFLANNVGVRTRFITPGGTATEKDGTLDYSLLSTLFISFTGRNLTLDHLLTTDAPAFRTADFASLAEARGESAFAPYLPKTEVVPDAWEFYGHLVYQEGIQNKLYVRWSKGYDDVCIWVTLPEDGGCSRDAAVDVNNPAAYDLRLYTIPWCDSVPEQYWDTVNCPAFWAEDMTREVVAARTRQKDTGSSQTNFQVIYPDGTLVKYECDGLTVDEMWLLVEETLPN